MTDEKRPPRKFRNAPNRTGRPELPPMTGAADFSDCGLYRFELRREWDTAKPPFVLIGLNPSTATAETNDPTIRRCIGFALREGAGSLVMLNLFPFRATDPKEMYAHAEPNEIRKVNEARIKRLAEEAIERRGKIVAAWGTGGAYLQRGREIMETALKGAPVLCFGLTKAGHPNHPLYLWTYQPLIPFTPSD